MPGTYPRSRVTNEYIEVWLEDLLYDDNYDITWGPHTTTGTTVSFHKGRTAHVEADGGRFRMNLGTNWTRFSPSKIYDDWDDVKDIVMRWLLQGIE